MLKVQMAINRDLQLELEDRKSRTDADKADLLRRIDDMESLNVKRLQEIDAVRRQLREQRYAVTKAGSASDPNPLVASAGTAATDAARERELLEELGGELSAADSDQNVVEVWVRSADLGSGASDTRRSTFFVVDFFNFESQATQLLPGRSPQFDFATTDCRHKPKRRHITEGSPLPSLARTTNPPPPRSTASLWTLASSGT